MQQAAEEPKGFGGWCVNAARSLRLSSPPVSQRVSVQGGRTTTSRPGGEISARHAARPRNLICPCDTLALPSHWSADHVTGCDWWRVTSDQLHQIWPGCCSWGQQQQQQHYALHSTQNPLPDRLRAQVATSYITHTQLSKVVKFSVVTAMEQRYTPCSAQSSQTDDRCTQPPIPGSNWCCA